MLGTARRSHTGHSPVVTLVPHLLDEVSGRRLQRLIAGQVGRGDLEHVLDLRPLVYVDSLTLAAFIRVLRTVRAVGGFVGVLVEQPDIRKVFSITGLDRVFEVYRNENEARSGSEGAQLLPA